MGQTIAEKILSENVGHAVEPGEIIRAEYDIAATHDAFTAPTIDRLEEWGGGELADPDRLVLVPDHYVPSHSEHAKHLYNRMKAFAEERGIERFYPLKDTGLMHNVLVEDGQVGPGSLVIGTDSHMVTAGAVGAFSTGVGIADMAFAWTEGWAWLRVPETVRLDYRGTPEDWVRGKDLILHTIDQLGVDGAVYKVIEFGGPLIETLPMDDRFSMSNMSIEAGAMTGVFEPDDRMREGLCEGAECGRCLLACPGDAIDHFDLRVEDCRPHAEPWGFDRFLEHAETVMDADSVEARQAALQSTDTLMIWQSMIHGDGVNTGCTNCADVCPVGDDYGRLAEANADIDEATETKRQRLAELRRAELTDDLPAELEAHERWIGDIDRAYADPADDLTFEYLD
jgi:3-isopropylmalate/(R)-2-methylmalate dehydratase large subunit